MPLLACLLTALTAPAAPSAPVASSPEPPPPTTAREFFNAGTQKLKQAKLKEAEAMFEAALAAQKASLQPPALYNLGHVRFAQGTEEIKKGPPPVPTAARARAVAEAADQALGAADQAIATREVQQLVAAYMRGRGVRKELREATRTVRKAMEVCGTTLAKWQRASGDFKGAFELSPSDTDARDNAETVDRSIALLIDMLRELEQAMAAMGQKSQQLGEKIKQMKGMIPEKDMPPGAAGDEEEDDQPQGPKPGDKEGPTREGKEMELSPEQAAWMLETYRLDSEHRLPMGQKDSAEVKARARKPW